MLSKGREDHKVTTHYYMMYGMCYGIYPNVSLSFTVIVMKSLLSIEGSLLSMSPTPYLYISLTSHKRRAFSSFCYQLHPSFPISFLFLYVRLSITLTYPTFVRPQIFSKTSPYPDGQIYQKF